MFFPGEANIVLTLPALSVETLLYPLKEEAGYSILGGCTTLKLPCMLIIPLEFFPFVLSAPRFSINRSFRPLGVTKF
jgi:hypothetical protein